MKYITQDWTSTKDGYLFFVQRLQEMLFHYSDDIVKAPVHNTQTLLEEYVDNLALGIANIINIIYSIRYQRKSTMKYVVNT